MNSICDCISTGEFSKKTADTGKYYYNDCKCKCNASSGVIRMSLSNKESSITYSLPIRCIKSEELTPPLKLSDVCDIVHKAELKFNEDAFKYRSSRGDDTDKTVFYINNEVQIID